MSVNSANAASTTSPSALVTLLQLHIHVLEIKKTLLKWTIINLSTLVEFFTVCITASFQALAI